MRRSLAWFALGLLALASFRAQADDAVDLSAWSAANTGHAIDYTRLTTLTGSTVDRTALGPVVLVHFWATWCKPCIKEFPEIAALAERLKGQGVTVLAVSVDRDGATDVVPFLAKNPVLSKMTVVLDPAMSLAKGVGIRIVPTTILDRNGVEQRRLIGTGEWNGDQGAELAELLKR